MNKISNTINRYDNMLYESRPVSLNEFLNNKYNEVHNELFNNALNKYIYEIINKYIDYNFIYNFYQKISGIASTENDDLNFEAVWSHYEKSYSEEIENNENIDKTDNSNIIKNTLDILSIDHKVCLKLLYNITVQKLEEVKNKLVKYYENEDGEFLSIIEGLSQISDIKDFRFVYAENIEVVALESAPDIITIRLNDLTLNSDNNFIFNANNYLVGSEESNYSDNNEIIADNRKYNEYVFLYEFENGIRIGYNRIGEWLLIVDDSTKFRNIESIPNLKSHIEKYMNQKSQTIHDLYKEAVCKLYKRYHKIIEIKQSEYWQPSSIFIINKISPFNKITVDLSKYWNMIQSNESSNINDLKITKENIEDSELIEINYVSGKAKLQSRTEDIIYEVPFKYLDENINVSDDMILSNSFISKYNAL